MFESSSPVLQTSIIWCGRSKTGHYDLVSCTLLCARACSKVLLTFSTTTTDFFSSPPARLLPHSYMSGQNLYLILDFKEILKIIRLRNGTTGLTGIRFKMLEIQNIIHTGLFIDQKIKLNMIQNSRIFMGG